MGKVYNPKVAKYNARLLLAPRYRPRTLREFLTNSLFNGNIVLGEKALKFLEYVRDNNGVERSKWEEILKHIDSTHAEFYFNIRQKLLGVGMVTFSQNRYIVTGEFARMLEVIEYLWKGFLGEVDDEEY